MSMKCWWNDTDRDKPEILGEKCPSDSLSTTNPTWIALESKPRLRGEGSVTDRLSQGTAA
jgi:hypothetical protein